eukprot:scaffold42458_cov155-Skeletonema_dohrnii-CCMP3373.AAC.1
MTNNNTSIGLLMEIVKPTTTAAAVDGVCNFNCGAICNNEANVDQNKVASEVKHDEPANKDIYPWDQSEERTSKLEDRVDHRDDHDHSAKPDYSEYARDCAESHRQEDNQRQHSETDLVQVSSEDAAEEGCLFGEFGFGHFILDLFSSLNPCRLQNIKDELKKAKESNAKLEWELKTQLLRLRQEREAMESKLRSEIDNEISQREVLQSYLEAEEFESDLRDDEEVITETTQIINALQTHKKEKLRSKPLLSTMSSTIGVSSTASAPESHGVYSIDEIHVAAE